MYINELYENKHDMLNYEIFDGIKIYTGTTEYSKRQLDSRINRYQQDLKTNKILTELLPSTLTAKGTFNNVSFNEEDIIEMLTKPVGGYILSIGCNYGVIINPSPDYTSPPKKIRTSKRGRKPKNKPKSKRKLQGSGKYFSSQITFEIYNASNKKIYKIKLFRNGGFQVPGVNKPDMSDLIAPIIILRNYLRDEFMDETIDVQYFISVMRNYICKIANSNVLIRLNELETLLKNFKEADSTIDIDELCSEFDTTMLEEIKKYMGSENNNTIGIAEIQNNCERYFGLILKFHRPVPWKMNKRTTIKVLRSGKINIDGGNSIEEGLELYYWIEDLFTKYKSTILYDKGDDDENSDAYSVGSAVSIYDDDIEENSDNSNEVC
jgi:hypothetical protein